MKLPKYSLHKASGQGYARIKGRCVYFGPHGDPESEQRYKRAMAELLAAGDDVPAPAPRTTTVREGVTGYLDAMRAEWGDGEKGDKHLVRLHHALDVVTDLFPGRRLSAFGVEQLEAVRAEMVRRDWSRRHINEQINVVRRCWKWLTMRGHVPAGVLERMQALEHLKAGRSPARESDRQEPPTPEVLAKVLARLDRTNPLVGIMVRVQLYSGARTGELVAMSSDRIDASGPVWTYRPARHKNLHRGKGRVIALPPEAIEAMRPLLSFSTDGKLIATPDIIFDPRKAVELRPRTNTTEEPGWRSGPRSGRKNNGTRLPTDRYTPVTYAVAVARACRAEKVEPFRPYALRHLAITRWAETLGPEPARVLAGHSSPRMLSVYVHTDASKVAALLVAPKKTAG